MSKLSLATIALEVDERDSAQLILTRVRLACKPTTPLYNVRLLLLLLFSPLGKVAGGLYILPMFFRYFFFNFFLMVDFLALVAQTLMEQSSPKFQDW